MPDANPSAQGTPGPKEKEGRAIPIEIVDALPPEATRYADLVFVNHDQKDFLITFAHIARPIIRDPGDLDAVRSVKAHVVAKVVVSPVQMDSIVTALSDNLRSYREHFATQSVDAILGAKKGG